MTRCSHPISMMLAWAMIATGVTHAAPPRPDVQRQRLVLLGTGGGPLLRTARAQSSAALDLPQGVLLIDAGEGCLERMTEARIPPSRIRAILITHLHADHVSALWSVLLHRWLAHAPDRLEIVGPPGTKALVDALERAAEPVVRASRALGAGTTSLASLIDVRESSSFIEGRFELSSFPDVHFRWVENSHLDADRDPGALEPSSLAYRLDAENWSILATGDTGPSSSVETLGRGVGVMVGEVVDVDAAMVAARGSLHLSPENYNHLLSRMAAGHLSPPMLGAMAAAIEPRMLLVSHIAPGTQTPSRVGDQVLAKSIAKRFKGPIVVARDLTTIDLVTLERVR